MMWLSIPTNMSRIITSTVSKANGIAEKPAFSGALYVFPESIGKLMDELRGRVTFAWGPEETDFGIRQFAIRDPDGYLLVFAEPL